MFKIGQILTNENYTDAAIWCNQNNATIRGLPTGRYEIIAKPEPSPAEILAALRVRRNILLEETDKYMLPDYPIDDDMRNHVVAYRKYLRDIPEMNPLPENILSLDEFISMEQ